MAGIDSVNVMRDMGRGVGGWMQTGSSEVGYCMSAKISRLVKCLQC